MPNGSPETLNASFAKQPVDREVLLGVLREAREVLEREEIPHLMMGGIAFSALVKQREVEDIDFYMREEDAERALEALGRNGFEVHRTNPRWIYKATRAGVIVDLIFESKGGLRLDDEMLARGRHGDYRGEPVPVLAPEDLLVLMVNATSRDVPGYWYDAIKLLNAVPMDHEYLLRRAHPVADRLLSFLLFCRSDGVSVPDDLLRPLAARALGDAASGPGQEAVARPA